MIAGMDAKESAELARLREEGKKLGASFVPLTKRQATAVRTILLDANGTNRERQTED